MHPELKESETTPPHLFRLKKIDAAVKLIVQSICKSHKMMWKIIGISTLEQTKPSALIKIFELFRNQTGFETKTQFEGK